MQPEEITAEDVLNAYRCGLFPMADSAESEEFYWYDPPLRGQLPIAKLHIPQRLRRTVLKFPFQIEVDTDFAAVIDACAAPDKRKDREKTWINEGIRALFIELNDMGYAHSVECWREGKLVGGLYGMALGSVFMGESMFSRVRDASKVALVHLCARLWKGGFTVLDTQFINEHLRQFGAFEIAREEYQKRLRRALATPADFNLSGIDERKIVKEFLGVNIT